MKDEGPRLTLDTFGFGMGTRGEGICYNGEDEEDHD